MNVDHDPATRKEVNIPVDGALLAGTLSIPGGAIGIVLFAHGSGSSRFSPRNREVANALEEAGFGTLLFDLLTAQEAAIDEVTRRYRFDIPPLGRRLVAATNWMRKRHAELSIGYFGASTGAGAALIAAAARPDDIVAVVSRGGRPDLAGEALPAVHAPTLLIVGGEDHQVIELNQSALDRMRCPRRLTLVPGAAHLFEEPGTLDEVIRLATAWFGRYLR
jgi:dienelactone hydrolase